jgi:glucan biosynthesis protein C
VPTLVYSLVAEGVVKSIIACYTDSSTSSKVWKEFEAGVVGVRGVKGPVWYCALLLIFDTIYTITCSSHFESRSLDRTRTSANTVASDPKSKAPNVSSPKHISTWVVLVALCFTATVEFCIRCVWDIGRIFEPLNLNIGYVPQYVLYYVAGIYVSRSGTSLHRVIGLRTLVTIFSLAILLLAYGLAAAQKSGLPVQIVMELAGGGFNTFALTYAFVNEFVGFIACVVLLKSFNNVGVLKRRWAICGVEIGKASYAVFLVHVPVLVGVMCALEGRGWEEKGIE